MAIQQFTTTPLSTDPTNFSARMDTRIVEQQRFVTEANDLATEMNLYAAAGAGAALAPSGYKNKIIGGDFSLNAWQRGTTFTAVADGTYTADRWAYRKTGSAVHTITKALDAPTAVQSGYYTQHSLGLNVTTAQTTFAAGDLFAIGQHIEGYNALSFGFGQAGTRFALLQFWVKGAVTGIHCVSIANAAQNRSYVKEYTINTANTWEFKTITFPVDTTGTWLYDNGAGLTIRFALASGTNARTTADAWQTGNFYTTANQVNEVGTTNNNFRIALVQAEDTSTHTKFEARSYQQELVMQLRYTRPLALNSAAGQCVSATQANIFSVGQPMRATPTISTSTGWSVTNSTGGSVSVTTINPAAISGDGTVVITATVASGLVAGNAAYIAASPANAVLSAELGNV